MSSIIDHQGSNIPGLLSPTEKTALLPLSIHRHVLNFTFILSWDETLTLEQIVGVSSKPDRYPAAAEPLPFPQAGDWVSTHVDPHAQPFDPGQSQAGVREFTALLLMNPEFSQCHCPQAPAHTDRPGQPRHVPAWPRSSFTSSPFRFHRSSRLRCLAAGDSFPTALETNTKIQLI